MSPPGMLLICSICFLNFQQLDAQNPSKGEGNLDKLIQFSGGASIFSSLNYTNDQNTSVNPFSYGMSISPVLTIKKIRLPFHFTYINGRSNYSTPFLRLGIAPTYKWIKVYLGHNTVNFGRYVFSGQNIFGVGFELTPKKFYFGFIKGRITQAHFIDSLRNDYNRVRPRFSSHGFALKTGIKSRSVHFLVSYFQGKDDPNSLQYFNPNFKLTAARNKAFGAEAMVRLGRNLSAHSNVGVSIYTRNVGALPLDSFLQATENTKLPSFASWVDASPNLSTQLLIAYDYSLAYTRPSWSVRIYNREIKPDFKTLGLRFINNDLSEYVAETTIRNKTNTFSSVLSIGKQYGNQNNKSKIRNENTIYSANVNYNPNEKFWINASYSNFGTKLQSVSSFAEDSLSISYINSNLSLNSTYSFENSGGNNSSVGLNFNYQNANEFHEFVSMNNSANNSIYGSISFSKSRVKSLNYNIGLSYSNSNSRIYHMQENLFQIESYGVFAQASRSWLKDDKLSATVHGFMHLAGVVSDKKAPSHGVSATVQYQLTKKLSAQAGYNYSSSVIAAQNLFQQYFQTSISLQF